MRFKLIHKGLVLVAVPVGFSLIILIYLTQLLQQADQQAERQLAAQSCISTVEDVQAARMISKAAMGLFLLSGSPSYAERHKKMHQSIDAGLLDLSGIYQQNPEKASILRRLLDREDSTIRPSA